MIPEIHIKDYNYPLPDERIAKYPLPKRDSSKLLKYNEGRVSEHIFKDLPELLPENSIMVFNNTKVVPARLHFKKTTGAHIEIFCLEPVLPEEYNMAFASKEKCRWKCILGNAKKIKNEPLFLYNPNNDKLIDEMGLSASIVERDGQTAIIEFKWKNSTPFSNVLDVCGTVPIPPYLNRKTESIDTERYQTLYAISRGSVAAPTAGLHFTESVLKEIRNKNIDMENVCLHVGAGTFLPVKSSTVSEHPMHREPFVVTLELLEKMVCRDKKIIAVGTTSVRTLESLYYAGVSCIEQGRPKDVEQWAPYTREYQYSTEEAIGALIQYLKANKMDELRLGTKIIIVPGFKFRLVNILITNFHQPESTLILLVSAFVSGDWKTIYNYALSNNFRFLSYGDSSLLFRKGNDSA